jgi:polyhydroxybutyrate depolymerase
MSGMLGGTFMVLEVAADNIVAIPSADGSQGGKWFFNTNVLYKFVVSDRSSNGCGKTSTAKNGVSSDYSGLTSFGNGEPRTWGVYIPNSYDVSTPLPLVLSLHGFSSNKLLAEQDSGLSAAAEAHGFIVAYPQGLADKKTASGASAVNAASWHAGGSADSPGPQGPICDVAEAGDANNCYTSCQSRAGGCADTCDYTTCVDDVAFIEALLDSLEASFCVNLDRVYVVGFSNGAMLTYDLAAKLPMRFSAAIAIAGSPHPGFLQPPCDCGCGPVPIMAIHGTADDVIPANISNR